MNYPFMYLFWVGVAIGLVAMLFCHYLCMAFRLLTGDKVGDVLDWD